MTTDSRSRTSSFVWVIVAYLLAGVAAWFVAVYLAAAAKPLWLVVLAADVVATCVVFASSVATNNSSMYDPYWSVAPMAIAPAIAVTHSQSAAPLRQWIVTALVLWWGARLTWNWARGWDGLSHEDWRYVDLRGKTGKAYWLVSFLGLHMMPTLWVYLGCLSLIPSLATSAAPLGVLDVVALAITVGAIVIETLADQQLRAFRLGKRAAGEIMKSGLWAYSRHPNYLGEVSFWWGMFAFALAADRSAWWCIVGPLAINLLFVFISIPLIEKRSVERRPAYREHMKHVPGLVPRPGRRAAPDGAPGREGGSSS